MHIQEEMSLVYFSDNGRESHRFLSFSELPVINEWDLGIGWGCPSKGRVEVCVV